MTISRRQFLEGIGLLGFLFLVTPGSLIRTYPHPLRPPGAVSEKHFIAKCIRCFKCGQACRAQAITFGSWADGQLADTPLLANLRDNPCTLCMECTNVCPTGALQKTKPDLKLISKSVKIGVAGIDTKRCLVWSGNRPKCHLCKSSCPYEGKALVVDAKNRPVVNQDKCVGCGKCQHFCPVEPAAITVRRTTLENFAIIQMGRYCPSLTLKSWLYRFGLGMKLGRHVSLGLMVMVDVFFPENITVGDDTIIGYNCTVLTHEYLHRSYHLGEVRIGRNVLIGANCTLLPGITIGDNAVIAACSLVNCDVQANSTVGGVPIKLLDSKQENRHVC